MLPLCGFLVFLACGGNLTPSTLMESANNLPTNNQTQPFFFNFNPLSRLCDLCKQCNEPDTNATTLRPPGSNSQPKSTTPSNKDYDEPLPKGDDPRSNAQTDPPIDDGTTPSNTIGIITLTTANRGLKPGGATATTIKPTIITNNVISTTKPHSMEDAPEPDTEFGTPDYEREVTDSPPNDNLSGTTRDYDEYDETLPKGDPRSSAPVDRKTDDGTTINTVDVISTTEPHSMEDAPEPDIEFGTPDYEREVTDSPPNDNLSGTTSDYDEYDETPPKGDDPRPKSQTDSSIDNGTTPSNVITTVTLSTLIRVAKPGSPAVTITTNDVISTTEPHSVKDAPEPDIEIGTPNYEKEITDSPTLRTEDNWPSTTSDYDEYDKSIPKNDDPRPIIASTIDDGPTRNTVDVTSTTKPQSIEDAPEPDIEFGTDTPTRIDGVPDEHPTEPNRPLSPSEKKILKKIKCDFSSGGLNHSAIIMKNNPENIVTSPINIAMVLAMASYGARSCTRKALDRSLNLKANGIELRAKPLQTLTKTLRNFRDEGLIVDNQIFVSNETTTKPDFNAVIQRNFQSELQRVDFDNAAEAATVINNWSRDRTNNRVPRFVEPEQVHDDIATLFTSVAYFNPIWVQQFNRGFTSHKPFYIDDDTSKPVPTMLQISKFDYGSLPELHSQFVELPLKGNGREDTTKMIIILPNKNVSLNSVIKNLNQLQLCHDTFPSDSTKKSVVELSLPRFKISTQINLKDYRKRFGLCDVFDDDDANFDGISEPKPFTVTSFMQKTVIDVNEGKCRSTNPTCGLDEGSSESSVIFNVNRPFIAMIVDKDIILSIAKVTDPSVHN